ncbi:hypothetical protein J5N97_024290 [Dioscorea zingiberensis]|uniref:Uncharacterized protein n=1 Tax=Dioscorea zingiberensis TaxID=325984 RepID=A0A9D5C6R1_9LILI|nr:hypothetical protein J5N97_024290 [Dioscorea zingiberensis]
MELVQSETCGTGVSQRKKVKFADMAKVHQENSRKQSLPLSEERAHVPNTNAVDEVKTLEYKSFKRLREETGREFNPYPLHKKDDNLNTSEASDCIGELTMMNSSNYDVCKSTPLVQRMTPRWFSPLTPKALQKFDCKEGGLFSSTRESILQFASTALSIEINELKSDRLDLIPEFLLRLGIKEKSSNLGVHLVQKKSDDMHMLLASSNSDDQHEYVHETRGMELVPANLKETLGEDLFPYRHGQIDKFILQPHETVAAEAFFTWPLSQSSRLLASSWLDDHHELLQETPREKFLLNSNEDYESILEARAFLAKQCASETSLQSKQMQSKWVSDIGRISYPLLVHQNPADSEELNIEFKCRKYSNKSTSHLTNNFGTEQALVPFINPASLEVSRLLLTPDLHSDPERKQCTPPLLGWRNDDVEAETGLPLASDRLLQFEPDHLALIPCISPGFLRQTPTYDALDQDFDGLLSSSTPYSDVRFKSWEIDFDRTWYSPISLL